MPAEAQDTPVAKPRRYPHLLARLFDTPLMAHEGKARLIASEVGPRLLGGPHAYGPGDPNAGDRNRRKDYYVAQGGIAVISIVGTLVSRGNMDALSGGPTSYAEIEGEIMDAATDPNIQGIVLDIDSPGGEVGGCFELARTIREAASLKPLYAAANHEAYSAAYALAAAAERVYMSEAGGVGSVGVIAVHADYSQFYQGHGVNLTVFRAGPRKAELNDMEPLTEKATQGLQQRIESLYDLFVAQVAEHRALDPAAVRGTESITLHGKDAIAQGFADQIGTLSTALADMRDRLNSTSNAPNHPRGASAHQSEESTMPAPETGANSADRSNVIDLETARKEGATYAAEVVELCALAGLPALAADFVRQGTPLADVRTALLKRKAAADDGADIESHHEGAPPQRLDNETRIATLHGNVMGKMQQQRSAWAASRAAGVRAAAAPA